eukprot:9150414-Pyramimonas_sp.AAC.1
MMIVPYRLRSYEEGVRSTRARGHSWGCPKLICEMIGQHLPSPRRARMTSRKVLVTVGLGLSGWENTDTMNRRFQR